MKVLIVDDSPDSIAIARARLAQEGLAVCSADGGRAGLEAARTERPDLILLDMDMPGMTGLDVCRALKGDAELRMIPVIFLSGVAHSEEKVKGLDLGAVDYVTKPFDSYELRARVRAALRTKRLQDLLMEHAHIDPLTGLPNRRALMERLGQEWARTQRYGGLVSVVMADIDNFKGVNDTFGHSIGDRLLCEVAGTLARQCRETDLSARYGGEEFAIVVPGESRQNAANLAERCRAEIDRSGFDAKGQRVAVTISLGVSDSADAGSIQEVVDQADKALYEAKKAGRNRVVCYESPCPQGAACPPVYPPPGGPG